IPIFSTSSLTDMPLVRLRELIMSRRWVRPISEIKRWFIELKLLEKNESAGLYTPSSLIRKPKIYTTLEYRLACQLCRLNRSACDTDRQDWDVLGVKGKTTSTDTRRGTRVG